MGALFSIFMLIFVMSMPFLFLYFYRWIDVVLTILTGDKKSLDRCNLCEDDPMWTTPPPPKQGDDHWRSGKTYSGGE